MDKFENFKFISTAKKNWNQIYSSYSLYLFSDKNQTKSNRCILI